MGGYGRIGVYRVSSPLYLCVMADDASTDGRAVAVMEMLVFLMPGLQGELPVVQGRPGDVLTHVEPTCKTSSQRLKNCNQRLQYVAELWQLVVFANVFFMSRYTLS